MQKDIKDLKVLFSSKEIIEKIKQQAQILNSIYDNNKTLIMICILKGAVMFYSELVKHLKMPVQMEFISLSSYGSYTKSTGEIKTINLTLYSLIILRKSSKHSSGLFSLNLSVAIPLATVSVASLTDTPSVLTPKSKPNILINLNIP